MSPRRSTALSRRAGVGLVLGATLVATACGSGTDARDPGAFCNRLRLVQPALTDATDPAALLTLYQDLDAHAPLQIRDDWHQLTGLIRQVGTFDPTDSAAVEDIQKVVLRSQASVTAVAVWAQANCNIELGPIPTTAPIGGTGDQLLSDQPVDTSATSDATDGASTDTGSTDTGSTENTADTTTG